MKRAIVLVLALAVVSAMAFADDMKTTTTWSGYVEGGATVTANSGGTTIMQNDANNGYYAQIGAAASLGTFAASVALRTTDSTAGTVLLHTAYVTDGLFNGMFTVGAGLGLGAIMSTAYEGNGGIGGQGVQVYVGPISGFTVGAFVPVTTTATSLSTAFTSFKVGVDYTMAKLFDFMASYDNGASNAEVSLNILAVPNLTAQLEAAISTNGGSTVPEEYFAYAIGNITPSLYASETLSSGAFSFVVKPGISYAMGVPTLGASVKYDSSSSAVTIDGNVKFAFNALATLKIDANYNTGTSTTTVGLDLWDSF